MALMEEILCANMAFAVNLLNSADHKLAVKILSLGTQLA